MLQAPMSFAYWIFALLLLLLAPTKAAAPSSPLFQAHNRPLQTAIASLNCTHAPLHILCDQIGLLFPEMEFGSLLDKCSIIVSCSFECLDLFRKTVTLVRSVDLLDSHWALRTFPVPPTSQHFAPAYEPSMFDTNSAASLIDESWVSASYHVSVFPASSATLGRLSSSTAAHMALHASTVRYSWDFASPKKAALKLSFRVALTSPGNRTRDTARLLLALSADPSVTLIAPAPVFTVANAHASALIQSGVTELELLESSVFGGSITSSEQPFPFHDAGLRGQGQIVTVGDTGLDATICSFSDTGPSIPYDTVSLTHRKIVTYVTTYGDGRDALNGHGTHVTGSIAGNTVPAASPSFPSGDIPGDLPTESVWSYRGLAPEAKVAVVDLCVSNCQALTVPADLEHQYFPLGYNIGSRVISNSWSAEVNSYTTSAAESDSFVYSNRDAVIVFAAANLGSLGLYSVGSPGIAKNVLTAGASMTTFTGFLDICCYGGVSSCCSSYLEMTGFPQRFSAENMASFSSRGPTADGRMKPDFVAPGDAIISSRSRGGNTAIGSVCTADRDNENSVISTKRGTSMATPLIAAAATLVRQYFENGYYPGGYNGSGDSINPSASLVRALFANGAAALRGMIDWTGAGSFRSLELPPNNVQGFGLIRLDRSLPLRPCNSLSCSLLMPSMKLFISNEDSARSELATGDIDYFCFTITSSATRFSVTLAWTDPPADPGCVRCLINDYDLVVVDSSHSTWTGNVLDPNTVTYDKHNNIERVSIDSPPTGLMKVMVVATNIPLPPQTFSLAVSGAFTATECSESPSFNTMCPFSCHSPNGVCVDGVCECPAYTFPDCADPACDNDCTQHGTCIQRRCVCDGLWEGIDCSQWHCAGLVLLSEDSGSLSTTIGLASYRSNSDCSWLIRPSRPHEVTKITFNSFATENSFDIVAIYDRIGDGAALLGYLSGSVTCPISFTSTTGELYVRFVSDIGIVNAGFTANYFSEKWHCAPLFQIYERNATIGSQGESLTYRSNSYCVWEVDPIPSPLQSITITFTKFDIERNYDFVRVYPLYTNDTETQEPLASFSGQIPVPFSAYFFVPVRIVFTSDSTEQWTGFSAEINSWDQCSLNCSKTSADTGGTCNEDTGECECWPGFDGRFCELEPSNCTFSTCDSCSLSDDLCGWCAHSKSDNSRCIHSSLASECEGIYIPSSYGTGATPLCPIAPVVLQSAVSDRIGGILDLKFSDSTGIAAQSGAFPASNYLHYLQRAHSCTDILEPKSFAAVGSGNSVCIWTSAHVLRVLLGVGASLLPGATLELSFQNTIYPLDSVFAEPAFGSVVIEHANTDIGSASFLSQLFGPSTLDFSALDASASHGSPWEEPLFSSRSIVRHFGSAVSTADLSPPPVLAMTYAPTLPETNILFTQVSAKKSVLVQPFDSTVTIDVCGSFMTQTDLYSHVQSLSDPDVLKRNLMAFQLNAYDSSSSSGFDFQVSQILASHNTSDCMFHFPVSAFQPGYWYQWKAETALNGAFWSSIDAYLTTRVVFVADSSLCPVRVLLEPFNAQAITVTHILGRPFPTICPFLESINADSESCSAQVSNLNDPNFEWYLRLANDSITLESHSCVTHLIVPSGNCVTLSPLLPPGVLILEAQLVDTSLTAYQATVLVQSLRPPLTACSFRTFRVFPNSDNIVTLEGCLRDTSPDTAALSYSVCWHSEELTSTICSPHASLVLNSSVYSFPNEPVTIMVNYTSSDGRFSGSYVRIETVESPAISPHFHISLANSRFRTSVPLSRPIAATMESVTLTLTPKLSVLTDSGQLQTVRSFDELNSAFPELVDHLLDRKCTIQYRGCISQSLGPTIASISGQFCDVFPIPPRPFDGMTQSESELAIPSTQLLPAMHYGLALASELMVSCRYSIDTDIVTVSDATVTDEAVFVTCHPPTRGRVSAHSGLVMSDMSQVCLYDIVTESVPLSYALSLAFTNETGTFQHRYSPWQAGCCFLVSHSLVCDTFTQSRDCSITVQAEIHTMDSSGALLSVAEPVTIASESASDAPKTPGLPYLAYNSVSAVASAYLTASEVYDPASLALVSHYVAQTSSAQEVLSLGCTLSEHTCVVTSRVTVTGGVPSVVTVTPQATAEGAIELALPTRAAVRFGTLATSRFGTSPAVFVATIAGKSSSSINSNQNYVIHAGLYSLGSAIDDERDVWTTEVPEVAPVVANSMLFDIDFISRTQVPVWDTPFAVSVSTTISETETLRCLFSSSGIDWDAATCVTEYTVLSDHQNATCVCSKAPGFIRLEIRPSPDAQIALLLTFAVIIVVSIALILAANYFTNGVSRFIYEKARDDIRQEEALLDSAAETRSGSWD